MQEYWHKEFVKHYNSVYQSNDFADIKYLKDFLSTWDFFTILCAFDRALDQGIRSLKILSDEIELFLPKHKFPKIEYFVKIKGSKEQKELWKEFIVLNSMWFPTASCQTRKKEIIDELQKLVDLLE